MGIEVSCYGWVFLAGHPRILRLPLLLLPLLLLQLPELKFSLSSDMVSQFAFGKSLDALADPQFKSLPVRVFQQYLPSLHVIKAFPFVRMLNSLPLWMAKRISHAVEMGHELEQVKCCLSEFSLLFLSSDAYLESTKN